MDNYDIVLFSPPSRMINHYRPPVGLLYIGGYLVKNGLRVKIIDVPLKEQIRDKNFFEGLDNELRRIRDEMLEEFRAVKTKIVGISCYTPEYYEALDLARAVKGIDPSVKIVCGGIHATFYPQELLEERCVDFCVLGEGEVTLYEFMKQYLCDPEGSFGHIEGLAYFDRAGHFIQTPARPLCDHIDAISYPDYSLIDMDYYTNANPYAVRGCFLRSMYILSSRGCPSRCSFCVAKKLRKYFGFGRVRSAENLIAELKNLKKKYAIDAFYFIDDLFTVNRENVNRFCRLLKEERLGFLWGCSSKVSTLNEDIIRNMADAGCIQIDFGVERGSDAALKLIKKDINVEMIKRIFRYCHKYGIRTFANMLVNIPKETENDLEDILKLLDEIRPEVVSLNIFTPYPGTEIYDEGRYRFTKEEYPLLSKNVVFLLKNEPDKFRFCDHAVDLEKWVGQNSRRYNRIWPNLKFYLSPDYLRAILKSQAKKNYVAQFKILIREFVNQKFT